MTEAEIQEYGPYMQKIHEWLNSTTFLERCHLGKVSALCFQHCINMLCTGRATTDGTLQDVKTYYKEQKNARKH
jgi:hypothetical protein